MGAFCKSLTLEIRVNKILIDTDIIIDVIRANVKAVTFLENTEKNNTLALSELTIMELVVGCRNKNEQNRLRKFLHRFEIIGLSETIGKKAIELLEKYYLSHHLLIPDALIASTSLILNTPSVTKNQKDYFFIKELNLMLYG